MVGTRVYILARRRMNIERNKYRVYYRILVSKILRVASVSLSLERPIKPERTRANPSESECD